jgi:alanyl-tRNA synthetase
LERTLAVLEGASNNFETELFLPIIRRISDISGRKYETKTQDGRRMRRISDHLRAVTFCVADGVLPSNEGRGYVERRLLRVAAFDGRSLGIESPFLHRLVPVVSSVMGKVYPEVTERRETIARIIKAEEEKFADTLDSGEPLIRELERAYPVGGTTRLPGKDLFRLFDTYGIPTELAALRLNVADETKTEFAEEMEKQRVLARGRSSLGEGIFVGGALGSMRESVPATQFLGHGTTRLDASVRAIIREDKPLDKLGALSERGESKRLVKQARVDDGGIIVVLDRTPFYPEQGGQVGDTGLLRTAAGEFEVTDTRNSPPHVLHRGRLTRGTLEVGERVEAQVDALRRLDVSRNHTATHLLHAALRQTLGEHAEQSGSLVAPDYLRFDFHHFEALTEPQLETIERLVNEKIMENVAVAVDEMDLETARRTGAKALFGEKYGDRVRVVSAGDFSRELCGGIHCERTGEIGQFKVTGEESVAAGIRRITAVTGRHALDYWKDVEKRLREVASELKTPLTDVVRRARSVSRELKELRKETEKTRGSERSAQVVELLKTAPEVGGVKVVAASVEDLSAEEMRSAVDVIRRSGEEAVAVLASVTGGKVALIAYAGEKARRKGIDAGKLIKEVAAVVGGGGGGRAELAQAGGSDVAKTRQALDLARQLIAAGLK